MRCVNLTHSTASPLRGEAERSSDEGGKDRINTNKMPKQNACVILVTL